MCPVKIDTVINDIQKELAEEKNISISKDELRKYVQELLDEQGIVNPTTLKGDIMREVDEAIKRSKTKDETETITESDDKEKDNAGKNTGDNTGGKAGDKTESNFWDDWLSGK